MPTDLECWGGYAGEAYGEGPELVAAFTGEHVESE